MKKSLILLPILLLLAACAAQPPATPDLTERVHGTLTALAQTAPQATDTPQPVPPTATQAPALSLDQLANGSYTSPDWGEFQLTNGIY